MLRQKFCNGVFILTVSSFFLLAFALLASLQANPELDYELPQVLCNFTLLVLLYALTYLLSQIYLNWNNPYDQDEGYCMRYASVFITYQMAMPILMIGLYEQYFALEIIEMCQLFYFVYLIAERPYLMNIQNLLLILCQLVAISFTLLLILPHYISIPDETMSSFIVAFLILLISISLLSLVRLYIHYKYNDRIFKKYNE
jgi:hypothetical protein